MISQKSRYALKALLALSRHYTADQRPVLVSDIVAVDRLPRKFLESILLSLKNEGILVSKKGKGGGFTLSRPPAEISVGDVVRAVDGPIALLSCVSDAKTRCEGCRTDRDCAIRQLFLEGSERTATLFDSTSLDALKTAHEKLNSPAEMYFI